MSAAKRASRSRFRRSLRSARLRLSQYATTLGRDEPGAALIEVLLPYNVRGETLTLGAVTIPASSPLRSQPMRTYKMKTAAESRPAWEHGHGDNLPRGNSQYRRSMVTLC